MIMSALALKNVLAIDAVTCAIVAAVGIFDAPLIAPVLGLPEAVVNIAGWICLPVAFLLGYLTLQPSKLLLNLVVVGNVGWVLASMAVVLSLGASMTGIGVAITVVQAIAVLVFVLFEAKGARQLAAA
jgi:hypothetical protein